MTVLKDEGAHIESIEWRGATIFSLSARMMAGR
jgi:hypothetical protein